MMWRVSLRGGGIQLDSAVTMRVAEGDEEGTRRLGVQLGHSVNEDIHSGAWSSILRVGRKADNLAVQRNHCQEIQGRENLMQYDREV
jgi:hypothetical protein